MLQQNESKNMKLCFGRLAQWKLEKFSFDMRHILEGLIWNTVAKMWENETFLYYCSCSVAVWGIADFLVTAGKPFYCWIYTLQSSDLDSFWSLDTSGANDQLINLNTMAWNDLKSPFQKVIYGLYI